jgi:hypothetical protein
VDRAHGTMDHWPDIGSQYTVDHEQERRGAVGAVWRGGDRGAFCRVGEMVCQAASGGALSRCGLLEVETTGSDHSWEN